MSEDTNNMLIEMTKEDAIEIAKQSAAEATKKALSVRLQNEAKLQPTDYMNPVIWKQMSTMAQTFVQSKAIPSYLHNTAQVMVVLQSGVEMGLKPMEALNDLYIVNGSVNLWGKGLIKRFRQHGYDLDFTNETNEATTAVVKKNGKGVAIETYTFKEAEQSGYTTDRSGKPKIGWKPGLNRRLKLRYGALSIIAKTRLPEVLGSVNGVAELQVDANIETKEVEVLNTQTESTGKVNNSLASFLEKNKKTVKAEVKQKVVEAVVVEGKKKKETSPKPSPKKPVKEATKEKKEVEPTKKPDDKMTRLRKQYFAEIKKQNMSHEDIKELEGFKSIKDLNEVQLTDLVGRIKG